MVLINKYSYKVSISPIDRQTLRVQINFLLKIAKKKIKAKILNYSKTRLYQIQLLRNIRL